MSDHLCCRNNRGWISRVPLNLVCQILCRLQIDFFVSEQKRERYQNKENLIK